MSSSSATCSSEYCNAGWAEVLTHMSPYGYANFGVAFGLGLSIVGAAWGIWLTGSSLVGAAVKAPRIRSKNLIRYVGATASDGGTGLACPWSVRVSWNAKKGSCQYPWILGICGVSCSVCSDSIKGVSVSSSTDSIDNCSVLRVMAFIFWDGTKDLSDFIASSSAIDWMVD
jgi:F0F1-type ATP synthase membrane subunit c/vacuolar-type H+-ATPase subunit K